MDRPVISGLGRAWARVVLRELVAKGPLKTHEFNALAWLAYGGRRLGENAYAIRQAPDELRPRRYDTDRIRARWWACLASEDHPETLGWAEFNARAARFVRELRLRRAVREFGSGVCL